MAFSCRKRAAQASLKKRAILRAKRSTATPCWASTIACRPPCNCLNHTTFCLEQRLNYGCATRRAQSRREPAAVFVPASLRLPSAIDSRLYRTRSGPRGASHSHFLMQTVICRAAWCATAKKLAAVFVSTRRACIASGVCHLKHDVRISKRWEVGTVTAHARRAARR